MRNTGCGMMSEISCTQKVMQALCDCAEIMLLENRAKEKIVLAQTIETLSRSLEILRGTKEEAEKALNNIQNGNSCEGGVQG